MDDLRKAYRIAVIIGLAMMASLLIYVVIVGIVEKGAVGFNGPATADRTLEPVKFALLGLTVIIFFVIRAVNARLLKATTEGGQVRQGQALAAPANFQGLTTAAVITYALCETPAVFGLVLFFMGRNSSDFHLFLLISLFFFAVHFPKFSQWEEWYRKQQGR